jgi:hypothetical protein
LGKEHCSPVLVINFNFSMQRQVQVQPVSSSAQRGSQRVVQPKLFCLCLFLFMGELQGEFFRHLLEPESRPALLSPRGLKEAFSFFRAFAAVGSTGSDDLVVSRRRSEGPRSGCRPSDLCGVMLIMLMLMGPRIVIGASCSSSRPGIPSRPAANQIVSDGCCFEE